MPCGSWLGVPPARCAAMTLISSGSNSQPEENIPRAAKMADISGGALMLELD